MNKCLVTLLFVVSVLFSMAQSQFAQPGISVGNVVEDLDKSVEFYTEVIGMVKTGEFSVDKASATKLGLTNKYQLDVTILKLEDSPYATEWKLMSLGTKAKHPKQNYMSDDTGMQYITLFVNHINPIIERCKKHNVEILSEEPSTLDDGRSFILIQDPDGTFIEMIGPN